MHNNYSLVFFANSAFASSRNPKLPVRLWMTEMCRHLYKGPWSLRIQIQRIQVSPQNWKQRLLLTCRFWKRRLTLTLFIHMDKSQYRFNNLWKKWNFCWMCRHLLVVTHLFPYQELLNFPNVWPDFPLLDFNPVKFQVSDKYMIILCARKPWT